MKNIILAAITLLFAEALQAHHVDPATARKVAQTFLAQRGIDIHGELQDMTAQTPFTEMYLFSTGGNDFGFFASFNLLPEFVEPKGPTAHAFNVGFSLIF